MILIMGIIYSLVTVSVTHASKTVQVLDSTTLGRFLRAQKDHLKRAFYLYGSDCNKVLFEPDINASVSIDEIQFSPKIQAYRFDAYGTLEAITFPPLIIDDQPEPVCLQFEVDSEGILSYMAIKEGKRWTLWHPYFDEVKQFHDQASASAWMQHRRRLESRLGILQ